MKQRIQDLITLLKRDRKTQVIAALIVLAVVFLFFGEGGRRMPPVKAKRPETATKVSMGGREAYSDLVTRFNADLESLRQTTHETKVALDKEIQESKEYEQRTAEIFKRILERIAETEAAVVNANMTQANMPISPESAVLNQGNELPEEDGLDTFGSEEAQVGPPAPPAPRKLAIVGTGDHARVKLLAGVHAPTDGTPYPVLFKLVSDVYGPDGSALPLGEAFLIAAAQGSLTDSRALFRLTALNMRLPDGRRKVVSVDGWVVGEDGIRGMEGVLIDPLGKAIGGAAIAGGLQGLGQAVSTQQVTNYYGPYGSYEVVTGDDTKYALGKALSGGAREWAALIRERANMLVPHVEVLSGREGTAIFSKSFIIKDLYDQLAEDNQHFASLD